MRPTPAVRWLIVLLTVAMYVASLLLPALQLRYHSDSHDHAPDRPDITAAPTYPPVLTPPPSPPPPPPPPPDHIISHVGWKMLLVSIAGPLDFNLAILANPLLLVDWSLFLMRRDRWTAGTLGVALLFAMQTFQLRVWGMLRTKAAATTPTSSTR
jgi:hypothetical protein